MTIAFGSRSRWSFAFMVSSRISRASHGVVLRLRMMDDDRRRALLGNQLVSARGRHAELALRGQNLEQLRVVLEVGGRAMAPGVALALTSRHAEVVAKLAMQPFGDCFRGF